jgi:N-terminal domain of anti-restriction factor ArdC
MGSVNAGLATYYAEQGHTIINSYKRWKEQGYQVKKGSKALLLWGEPKPIKKKGEQPPKKEGEEDTFFPLAYVFSNLQVEPLVTPAMKR